MLYLKQIVAVLFIVELCGLECGYTVLAAPAGAAPQYMEMSQYISRVKKNNPGSSLGQLYLGTTNPMTEIEELTLPLAADHAHILRCGGLDRRADRGSGSGYAWCNMVFEAGYQKPYLPKLRGFSFGIQAWDTWSKYMVNHKGVHEMHLFDCFSDGNSFIEKQYKLYDVDPIYHNTCVGPRTETITKPAGTIHEFKTFAEAYDWGKLPKLSAVVKIDIEGSVRLPPNIIPRTRVLSWICLQRSYKNAFAFLLSQLRNIPLWLHLFSLKEWAVFDQMMGSSIFVNKVASLDLEVHWCMPQHQLMGADQRESILRNMRRFKRFFYVTGRWADIGDKFKSSGGYENAGCEKSRGQYQMMSVSYVNKQIWTTDVSQVDSKQKVASRKLF